MTDYNHIIKEYYCISCKKGYCKNQHGILKSIVFIQWLIFIGSSIPASKYLLGIKFKQYFDQSTIAIDAILFVIAKHNNKK